MYGISVNAYKLLMKWTKPVASHLKGMTSEAQCVLEHEYFQQYYSVSLAGGNK